LQSHSPLRFFVVAPSFPEVVGLLEIHPELGRVLEDVPQLQRHDRRNSPLASTDFIHDARSAPKTPGKLALGHAKRKKELLFKHFSNRCGIGYARFHHHSTPVVINDRDVCRAIAGPLEDNSPLVIDAYRVEPFAVAMQCFKPISWWSAEVFQPHREGQLIQFPFRNAVQGHIKRLSRIFGVFAKIDVLGASVGEGLDHTSLIRLSRYTTLWNRFFQVRQFF
jgi:hypothetical protein